MPKARTSSQLRGGNLHISVDDPLNRTSPSTAPSTNPSSPNVVELADVLEERDLPPFSRILRAPASALPLNVTGPSAGDDSPTMATGSPRHQHRTLQQSASESSMSAPGPSTSNLTTMSSQSTATLSAVAASSSSSSSGPKRHSSTKSSSKYSTSGVASAVSSRRPSSATLNPGQAPSGPPPAVPALPPGTTAPGQPGSQSQSANPNSTGQKIRIRNTPHLHNTNVEPVSPSLMYWSRAPVHGLLPTRNMRAHSVNLIGDLVWLFGGCDDKGCWRDIWTFDVETFQWSHPEMVGAMPPPCRAHTSTLVDRKLIIFGGGEGPTYYNQLYILDTVTYRWTHPDIKGDLPPPRRAHTAVFYRGCLYVFGGGNGQAALNDLWRLDLSVPIDRWEWVEIKRAPDAPVPPARGYHTSNLIGNVMVIMGGSDGKDCFADVWALDLDTFIWRELHPDPKYRRLSHSSTQVGSYLFIIGGHDGTKYLQDILLFNLVSSQFEARHIAGKPPSARGYHVCVLADSRLFLFGGFDGHAVFDDVWILDLAAAAYLPQVTSFSLHYSDEDDDANTVEGVPI